MMTLEDFMLESDKVTKKEGGVLKDGGPSFEGDSIRQIHRE